MTRLSESVVPTPVLPDLALNLLAPLTAPNAAPPAASEARGRWGPEWALVARAFDALGQGLLVCPSSGESHGNGTYHALVARRPDGPRIRATSETLSRALLEAGTRHRGRPSRSRLVHLRTDGHRYQLRGTRMAPTATRELTALVAVVRWPLEGPAPDVLRDRFGLTRRQALVARLLAERRTNKEIARQLGISPHTAKRHTEQVLLKLGVASRRSVGELLKAMPPAHCTGRPSATQ